MVQLDEEDGLKTKPDSINNDEPLSRTIQTALMGKGKEIEKEKDNHSGIKKHSSTREKTKEKKKRNGRKVVSIDHDDDEMNKM